MKAKKMAWMGKEFYTWTEPVTGGVVWLAAWRRFDLVAQGSTERLAVERLIRTIAGQAMADAAEGVLTEFGSCSPPAAATLKRWQRAHERNHQAGRRL